MGFFEKYNPHDLVYLLPLEGGSRTLPEGTIEMLFADARGNLVTSDVEVFRYEALKQFVKDASMWGRGAAAVLIEIAPGQSASFAVEINAEHADALTEITSNSEGCLNRGVLPDSLRRHVEQIIKAGQKQRKQRKRGYDSTQGPTR